MAGLIDVGILKPELANTFGAAQARQQAEQQNALRRQQLQVGELELKRLQEEREIMLNFQQQLKASGKDTDLDKIFDALISTGKPEYMMKGVEGKRKLQEQKAFAEYLRRTENPEAAMPTGAPAAAPAPTPAPTPTNALTPAPTPAAASTNALTTPAPSGQELQRRYRMVSNINTPAAKAEAQLILKQIENDFRATMPPETIRTMTSLGYPATPEGYQAFQSAQRPPQQPAPLVPVLQNGKPTLVPREQAVGQTPLTSPAVQILGSGTGREAKEQRVPQPPSGYRFTPSGDLEPIPGGPAAPGLTPKDIQKREAVFPQATQAVKGFETKSDLFIKDLERLRDDPGLNQITGPIYGRTPSVSQAGSRAQALYNKIFAKGGFQALQDMREASKTGGALGNVSNEEGRRLERSIVGGLDRTQNIKDVKKGINDLIDEIRTSKSRVREAYDSTYEYRTQQGAAPAQPASTGGWSVVR